jgi:hypothetical protein
METINDQTFLLDFIDQFTNDELPEKLREIDTHGTLRYLSGQKGIRTQGRRARVPKAYENIALLDGGAIFAKNKLQGVFSSEFLNRLEPQHWSLLTPEIKLIKKVNVGGGEYKSVPYPINQITTVDSITKSIEGRGTDVALTNLTWRDTGTDIAYAGVTIEGNLKLTFQSFEALFMPRPTGVKAKVEEGGKMVDKEVMVQFSDLTTNVPTNLKPQETDESLAAIIEANQRVIPPFELEIRAGWSVPTDPGNVIFTPDQIKIIETLRSVLQVQTHRINLNIGDGGVVKLDCQFTGRLESAMNTQKYDLFMIDENSEKEQVRAQTIRTLNNKRQKLSQAVSKAKNEEKLTKAAKLQSEFDLTTEQLFSLRAENLPDAWGKLLGYIESFEKNSRLFYVDVPREAVQEYLNLSALRAKERTLRIAPPNKKGAPGTIVAKGKDGATGATMTKEDLATLKKLQTIASKKVYRSIKINMAGSDDVSDFKAKVEKESNELIKDARSQDEVKTKVSKVAKPVSWQQTSEQRGPGLTHRINYFFLGDLFEAAMGIIHWRPETKENCDRPVVGKTNPHGKYMYKTARLLLGSVLIVDPKDGQLKPMNLADIPISMEQFKIFFYKSVVAEGRSSWPLRKFLADVCSKLVTSVLKLQTSPVRKFDQDTEEDASGRMTSLGDKPTTHLEISTLNIPKNSKLDNLWMKGKRKRIEITELEEAQAKLGGKSKGSSNTIIPWIYISAVTKMPKVDNVGEALKLVQGYNIPHLLVGNATGLVKNISFTRDKVPGLLASSILRGVDTGVRSQLLMSDKYDANVSMLGNAYFKPGMAVYIDPRSLGLGPNVGMKWAMTLGLGGFYRIIGVEHEIGPGMYYTKIATKSEFGLRMRDVLSTKIKSVSTTKSIEEKPKQGS